MARIFGGEKNGKPATLWRLPRECNGRRESEASEILRWDRCTTHLIAMQLRLSLFSSGKTVCHILWCFFPCRL